MPGWKVAEGSEGDVGDVFEVGLEQAAVSRTPATNAMGFTPYR
jgi:hypothetical protein